jgi:small-conductance mechanosensitive channel
METTFIIICGFVTGILLMYFLLFIIKKKTNSSYSKDDIKVHYMDIKGKKANATLHTGMSKNSVLILVGTPENVDLNSVGNSTYEVWAYKSKNNYIADLVIDFENGKLKGVQQG